MTSARAAVMALLLFAAATAAGHGMAPHEPGGETTKDCDKLNGEWGSGNAGGADSDEDSVPDRDDSFPSDASRTGCNSLTPVSREPVTVPVEWGSYDKPYGTDVKYRITRSYPAGSGNPLAAPVYTAKLKIELTGDRDPKREAQWKKCAEEMWSEGDVKLDLEFVESDGDAKVNVVSGKWSRSDAGNWYVDTPTFGCATIAHEIGHNLGLDDEYCDPADPDRFIGEDDDIMRAKMKDRAKIALTGRKLRAYPRHFDFIKRNFHCPPASGREALEVASAKNAPPPWKMAGLGGPFGSVGTSNLMPGTDPAGSNARRYTPTTATAPGEPGDPWRPVGGAIGAGVRR